MKKFKVIIPYWDTGVRKKFDVEFIVESKNQTDAVETAKKMFNKYEGSSFASWIREMYENEITIEEVQ
ncbi:hypothetical protein KAJ27_16135 [bacterium]|nr:hypothetical protein [bacterium]